MRMHHVLLLPFVVACYLGTTARPADETDPPLDPVMPYRAERSNPVTYDVDFSVVVTPPYHAKLLRVWLPIPQSDAAQQVIEREIASFPIESTPSIATEQVFGNRFAYFEFDHPEGAQIIRHKFQVKVWELRWNVNPEKVTSVSKWPEAFGPFLRSDEQAVVVNDQITQLLDAAVPDRRGPANDLTSIMRWVNGRMTYDHKVASLAASSLSAIEKSRGHCSDYHGLCASMSRALGYPSRVTYGINPFPRNSPSHCKLEVYLPPYGWVSFDVSETQRLIESIQKDQTLSDKEKQRLIGAAERRLSSGFRDNTWFLQTRGTDYELVPPASHRVPVVRTIYAEADGVALPDPDPANEEKHEFAWMTVHKYVPDRPVTYPFKDLRSLETQP